MKAITNKGSHPIHNNSTPNKIFAGQGLQLCPNYDDEELEAIEPKLIVLAPLFCQVKVVGKQLYDMGQQKGAINYESESLIRIIAVREIDKDKRNTLWRHSAL